MSLDFGTERGWSESNFVLVDGEDADFQPITPFDSISSVNFHWLQPWLISQNATLNIPKQHTTTGLLIFHSESYVNLYFHEKVIKGLVWQKFNLTKLLSD